MTTEKEEIFNRCLEEWGELIQVTTAMEELAELLHALSKIIRGKLDREHLAEEIAEVQLFLWELTQIYDLQEFVDFQIQDNLINLEQRLDTTKGKTDPTPTITNYIRKKLDKSVIVDNRYEDEIYR